jgi:hypothetical protein
MPSPPLWRPSVTSYWAGSQASRPALRQDEPHVSICLDKRVQKVIKEIALPYDRGPHGLYIDGHDAPQLIREGDRGRHRT